MQPATQAAFAKDSWQTPRNARTLRAFMALRNQEIGARLRELRGEKPQTAVADELGVAERTYQNWEAGDAKPSYRNLQRLAKYHGVTEEFILAGATLMQPLNSDSTTPDLSRPANGTDDRLARIEQALVEMREERARNVRDIQALLERQDGILQNIEAAIRREEEAKTDAEEATQRLLAAVAVANRALSGETQAPAVAPERQAK